MTTIAKTLERERGGKPSSIPETYEITVQHLTELINRCTTRAELFDALCDCYEYGFIRGRRAEKRNR